MWIARALSPQTDRNEFFCHPVPLGNNLYDKEGRPPVVPPARKDGGDAAAAAAAARRSTADDPAQAAQQQQGAKAGKVSII